MGKREGVGQIDALISHLQKGQKYVQAAIAGSVEGRRRR